MNKRILLLIIIIGIYCCLPFEAYGLEVPKLQGYVNDYAGMIGPETKARLEAELKSFEDSDSTQIVILTLPSLEGEEIRGFGIKVGEVWKIGQKKKDNGAILIVSKQDRKIGIEVGYGLEGKLTDLLSGRIINQVIKPKFRDGDFDGGFTAGISSMIDATRGEFKADQTPDQREVKGGPPFLTLLMFLGFFTLIMGSISRVVGGMAGAIGLPALVSLTILPLAIPFLILLALVGFGGGFFLPNLFSAGKGGRYHSGGGGFFSGGGGFGGGGFSSGGGGFSGGGGSFGGGGASGSW